MDILYFHVLMLETSNMGGEKQSMGVQTKCVQTNIYANANDRLANKDLTPRLLNLSIRSVGSDTNWNYLEGGWIGDMANP